jgi:hypothetical protein
MIKCTNWSVLAHRSAQLGVNRSHVLEALEILPTLINPKKIDSHRAQKAQDILIKAGFNITSLMIQASFLLVSAIV